MEKQINKDEIKEIDLKIILNFLFRNKYKITIASLIFFIFSAIISLCLPKTWEGSFQIVLQEEDVPISDNLASLAPSNILRKRFDVDTNTQIGILESPSVLMPIFDFVRKEKEKKGIDTGNWVFQEWKDTYLNISLERGTKILNLSLQDQDIDIILPTLNLISDTYQAYSGLQKEKNLKSAIFYLDKQLADYEKKNKLSQKKLVELSFKNDIEIPNLLDTSSISGNEARNELSRSKLASDLRLFDEHIKILENLNNTDDTLQFIRFISRDLNDPGIKEYLREVSILKGKINNKSSFYREKLLKKEKKILELKISQLKKETLNALRAKKLNIENKSISISRPLDVIIQQRELALKAKLELVTIEKLQNERRGLALELTKMLPPWKLITNPTLLESPVSPRKKRISLIGGIIGFILISIYLYIKELKSNILYEEEYIKKILKNKLLINLRTSSNELIKIYFKNLDIENESFRNKYGLIIAGIEDDYSLDLLKSYLSNYLTNKDILIDKTFSNIDNFEEIIIITRIGEIKKSKLEEIKKIIDLTNKNIHGFINF